MRRHVLPTALKDKSQEAGEPEVTSCVAREKGGTEPFIQPPNSRHPRAALSIPCVLTSVLALGVSHASGESWETAHIPGCWVQVIDADRGKDTGHLDKAVTLLCHRSRLHHLPSNQPWQVT